MSRKWALLILLSLPLWLVCGIAIGRYYIHAHKSHETAHYYDEAQTQLESMDLIVQSIMAFGTLGLLLYAWKGINAANKTAADALKASTEATKQTKRSVDTYIDRERGQVRFHRGTFGTLGPHLVRLHYSFRNIGSGPATITYFDGHIDPFNFEGDPPAPWRPHHLAEHHIPLLSGEGFASYDVDGMWKPPHLGDWPGAPSYDLLNAGHKSFLIQFQMIYETQFGKYRYHCARFYSGGYILPFDEAPYTMEVRLDKANDSE